MYFMEICFAGIKILISQLQRGKVWKFPYICGKYGGATFILIYLVFLAILGYPIIVCEFAVGRGSQKSCAASFKVLEPEGTRWHQNGIIGMAGNYLLMMFYTMVCGWMIYYFCRSLTGEFSDTVLSTEQISEKFSDMLASPWIMIIACLFLFMVFRFSVSEKRKK